MSSFHPARTQGERGRIDDVIRGNAPLRTNIAYWRLIDSLRQASTLLSPHAVDVLETMRICRMCNRLALRDQHWVHAPESWIPGTESRHLALRSFVQHVLDAFPVPGHMAKIWHTPRFRFLHAHWYLQLARGESVRRIKFSGHLKLSKSEARFFMQAPDDATPEQAVRYAQAMACGSGHARARDIMLCLPSVADLHGEPFWQEAIRFLVRLDCIDRSEMQRVVHFCQAQRFTPSTQLIGPLGTNEPLQPNLSLKGRSLRSVRRMMVEWENELKRTRSAFLFFSPDTSWPATSIEGHLGRSETRTWRIEEVLTPRMLRREGNEMRNCVMSYLGRCVQRQTSIWSLSKWEGRKRQRRATIEVDPTTRQIRQALGRWNCDLEEEESKVLREWAEEAELSLAKHLA